MGLFNFFTQEIAMDLGTANTLIIHNDEVVVNEPSIIALNRNNMKEVLGVGKKALLMHEKTHESIRTIRPLKDGVIADFNAAELMIRELMKMIYPKKPLFPPSWRMVICIPSSITEVEKRAVRDSAEQAGAKEVYMIHEPMAAALGIGIDVEEPVGNMIIDIGGGDSKLVDYLLAEGYEDITVLDISANALERAKERLGEKGKKIKWIVSDITEFKPNITYDIWHDRATFHFLTSTEQINIYLSIVEKWVTKFLIIGTFSDKGPTKCSGLEIKQYTETTLEKQFNSEFEKVNCINQDHKTPFETIQNFIFCVFKKR